MGGAYNHTSPDFPFLYPPNMNCKWTIISDENSIIVVYVKEFHLERGFDFLTIGTTDITEDTTVGTLTGIIKLRSFTGSGGVMVLGLKTDNTGNFGGFNLAIEQVHPSSIVGEFVCVIDIELMVS